MKAGVLLLIAVVPFSTRLKWSFFTRIPVHAHPVRGIGHPEGVQMGADLQPGSGK
jgi:hypothetical protein